MNSQSLVVLDWPLDANKLSIEHDLIVIGLKTAENVLRAEARLSIRIAIQEALAFILSCPASEIQLDSQAGQALKLLDANSHIGLSVSHEPELSIAAINMNGNVGVDLMAIRSIPEEPELHTIALEFLGVEIVNSILLQPIHAQKIAFAKAWTSLEASLKLKGEALIEWGVGRDEKLINSHLKSLVLGDGYVGTIAY
jgi:4'-phosphopantetheinyl transferase